jgi:hypothetical protein
VSKAKGLIMDYRKGRAKHTPIHINEAIVERVESFKLLGVHIPKDLWSKHTKRVVKKARQHLFPLKRLKDLSWDLRSSKSSIAAPSVASLLGMAIARHPTARC